MTSRSTTPPEDSTHANTTTGTATVQVAMTIMIGATPVTVTMTIMIEAAQPTTATTTHNNNNNNNNNYSRDVSETEPPSGILSYGGMNEWSSQFYAPSQPGLLPAVTITTSNEMARSNIQEHNGFSPLALSPLTNLSLNSSPPLISYPHYMNNTPEEVNYYEEGLLSELFDPLYTTAITSMTTTVPVQQLPNNTSYSSLLTDSHHEHQPSSSPLVFEENQEIPVPQEDTYSLNETIENEQ
ncbi:hypothetical protein INT45_005737 [Circinella minor]|uniref:Uncharacterized protein n=1 Tax=Circinella minor TaxID=1195481 RepID=A0A8H7SCG5_9FUNG|nr:hypothetical protein INT45_005737 [Circinella minor]